MKLVILLTFILVLASCGSKKEETHSNELFSGGIYGGVEVSANKWSNVIGFAKKDSDGKLESTFCSGTLISKTRVLSAAHCFKKSPYYYINKVVVTRDSISAEAPRVRKIKSITKHPFYKGADSGFDFAVVELAGEFDIEEDQLVPNSKMTNFSIGQDVEIVGFGKRENGESGIKYEALTRVRENQKIEFVAGGEGKDTCSGDSGGPVFTKNEDGRYEFVGITSRTPDEATAYCGDKTIYGKVAVAMKWVKAYELNLKAKELNNLESIEILKQSQLLFSNYYDTYMLIGKISFENDLYAEAKRAFQTANQLRPKLNTPLEYLLKIVQAQGDIDHERLVLGRLLVLNPAQYKYFERLSEISSTESALLNRGVGYFKKDRLAFAYLDLENLGTTSAKFLLSFISLKMENPEDALKHMMSITDDNVIIVDIADRNNDTYLIAAIYKGNLQLVKEVLRLGANRNVFDAYNNSPTALAWWSRNLEILDYLIEQGFDFKVEDYFEQFLSLVSSQKIKEVRFLLKHGMDPTIVGPDGVSAVELAKETRNQELIDLISLYTSLN
ncbi:trypsin-like serine protease [Halobacteriovorax sp. HLS]|uniref:trypsin-like serine protease n=1 Tax=Halobacteriovorax sp. HLS TaxID=2234000 RepID=UPI000FDBA23B|nr:trypsin-like serine protease [Halobacteriovorax sp. HLS]